MNILDARRIRVGSRRSELALAQTRLAINFLRDKNPQLQFDVVEMSTTGDKILDVSLPKIGDKNLFTKELEIALVNKEIDFIVHSLKDVSTVLPDGLVLGCVFNRISPDDVVLMSPSRRGQRLCDLPHGAVIGTSSLRRVASLSRIYPHLEFVSVRGNLNTRLMKLDGTHESCQKQRFDALILAKAGVERLGWADRIDEVLTKSFYAVGQGALTCECRQNDPFILDMLSHIHEEQAALTSIAERSLMRVLDAGCHTPLGVRSVVAPEGGMQPFLLTLHAAVLNLDGTQCVETSLTTNLPYRMTQCKNPLSNTSLLHSESGDTTGDDTLSSIPSDDELSAAHNPASVFMGVMVAPSCPVARLRMARAQYLGFILSKRLLTSGGSAILEEIKALSK